MWGITVARGYNVGSLSHVRETLPREPRPDNVILFFVDVSWAEVEGEVEVRHLITQSPSRETAPTIGTIIATDKASD